MGQTVALLLLVIGAALIYKGWRGIGWPEFYREIATERGS